MTDGGQGIRQYSHTAKTRAKISASKKGRKIKPPSHQFSYASLAKLMGVNASVVSRKMLESRGSKFNDKDIIKLVEIFSLPAEYLMKRADEE